MFCTNIDQSKKLLAIGIDPLTSDMLWVYDQISKKYVLRLSDVGDVSNLSASSSVIPSWSLVALFDLMPTKISFLSSYFLTFGKNGNEYCCRYEDYNADSYRYFEADNPIDSAFQMLCFLKENNFI